LRPLHPTRRWRRIAPFGAVAALGFALSPIPPAVPAGLLLTALGLFAGILAAIAWLPWRRWPVWTQATPAFAYFGIIALLRHGSGGAVSGFAPLLLVPLFWLALYHGPRLLLAGIGAAGAVLLLPLAFGAADPANWRLAALWVAGGGMAAWTAHGLVRRVSADASALRVAAADLAAASAEVRRERDFTTAVLDAAGFLAVVTDTAGRITLFNRRCEEVTGLRAADVVGRPFVDTILPAADAPAVRAAFNRLPEGDFPHAYENDWVAADGERRTIVWRNSVLTDENGHVTHIVGTGLDVTDQRRTEGMLAHVLEAATEQAIIATDPDGLVTVFNAGAERLLGYRPAEVIGHATPMLWHRADEVAQRAAALGIAPGPQALRGDPAAGAQQWMYLRKDGREVPVEVNTSGICGDRDVVVGYLAVAHDITRGRQAVEAMQEALRRETAAADRLRELDQVRTDLVATVSHELRTPLTSILGNVELLADGDAGPLSVPQARLVAAIERNARRLLSLIEDLLMLSRIEAGTVKINARPVPVRAIVGGALEALQSVRAGRGVALEVELPPDPVSVLGDQAQLERVLINLVDNGLKFTPSGGRVRVSVAADDVHARLVVTDTGMGIPPEEVDHIFDRFFRSTRSQEQAAKGTGLGLAITKSIVERHGGQIWARSGGEQPGTEITCLLPRA